MHGIWLLALQRPAAILSFSFKKATPPSFAPWRQLPRLTIGALHCTGTVAEGLFRGMSQISDPVLLLSAPGL